MRMMAAALVVLLIGCSGDRAELEKRLKDHEERIASLEEQLSRVELRPTPRKSPVASSTPLPSPPRIDVIPVATETGSPAIGFSPNSGPTEDQRLAIRALCSRRFGSDWKAVEQCEDEELEALAKIAEGNREKLPPEIYGAIRVQCAQQGRGEFTRQAACQEEQIEAYLRTQ